ncbi:hypothetical protein [Fusobacterium nucleatum]
MKKIQKSLTKSWLKVRNTLKGVIDKYGLEVKSLIFKDDKTE